MTRFLRQLLCLALVLLAVAFVLGLTGCGVTADQRQWEAQQALWEAHQSLHTEEMNQRIKEAK